jgi:hypothetical protein
MRFFKWLRHENVNLINYCVGAMGRLGIKKNLRDSKLFFNWNAFITHDINFWRISSNYCRNNSLEKLETFFGTPEKIYCCNDIEIHTVCCLIYLPYFIAFACKNFNLFPTSALHLYGERLANKWWINLVIQEFFLFDQVIHGIHKSIFFSAWIHDHERYFFYSLSILLHSINPSHK